MGEAAALQELVKVAARDDGWSVRLVEDGSLISVQKLEEEANEIADLLTFKLAVDRSLPLESLLLRVQGSFADFLQAEEGLRKLSWKEFLSNLTAVDEARAVVAAPGEPPAAEQQGGPPAGDAATAAAAAAILHSSSQQGAAGTGVGRGHSGNAERRLSLPAVLHQQQPQQVSGAASAAPAPGGAGFARPAAALGEAGTTSPAFWPPPKLIGCYRQPPNNPMLSVQVSVKDAATGKERSTYFGGSYSVPAAAGMARDVARLWTQHQRGEPLERVVLNFPLPFYTRDAELMAKIVGAADAAALKAAIVERFMSAEGQRAAAAAAAAAGLVVPSPPPLGDAAAAAAAVGRRSQWKLLPEGGAQKQMTANCQNALCITDQAWAAIFGYDVAAPRIWLQLASGEVFHVSVGHAPDRGRPLGRGWKEAAKAMQLQRGDTLTLRGVAAPGGEGGGAGAAGATGAAGEPCVLATVARSPAAAAPTADAADGKPSTDGPASLAAAGTTAAAGSGGYGCGATPLAGRKRTAEEGGLLLRSPGGTLRQRCVDKMLAAARVKQADGAPPQQQPAAYPQQDALQQQPAGFQAQQLQTQVKQEWQEEEEGAEAEHRQQVVPAELQVTQPMEEVLSPVCPPQHQQPPERAALELQRQASGAGGRSGQGGGMPPPAPHARSVTAAAVAATAGAPAEPSPYELYSRMKPAVKACGLPAASRHAYFHVFLHMDRSTQRIHCDEVLEMAEERLLDQLRQFLEAELAAAGAAAPASGVGPTVSTLSGGTSRLQGLGGVEQRASSRP